jgi:hypothetical protein
MVRDAKEEAKITLNSKDLILVHVIHRFENQERVDFFFNVNK